jgi:hypothetical protein
MPGTEPDTGQDELPLIAYQLEPASQGPAMRHFGHGILTLHLPFLFRTPPGWNLLVRGPANRPKDGAAPLEGLVEELERFRPSVTGLAEMPDMREYFSWCQARSAFLDDLAVPGSAAARAGWQRDYMAGTAPDGRAFAGHQRRLRLRDWVLAPGRRARCR